MQHQPMPVIQQGMQYPSYGYPQHQQQGNYGYLAQPTPMRPPPHPHSSASSSISSRSYHSYHDASRPHSRGSTTSNMSATSSVRFGSLYPANQGGGTYRQTRRKHHGNGVNGTRNGTIGEGQSNDSREMREHSPVRDPTFLVVIQQLTIRDQHQRMAHPIHPVEQEVLVSYPLHNIPFRNAQIGQQTISHIIHLQYHCTPELLVKVRATVIGKNIVRPISHPSDRKGRE